MRKIIICILIGAFILPIAGQKIDPTRDFRKHYFWGIAFCATQAKMRMELDKTFYEPAHIDSLVGIMPQSSAGGGFGGTFAYKFGKDRKFELKTQTMLQLHQRNLQYYWKNSIGPNIKIETISFDVPVDLKYYSDMPKNTRFYVLAGLRWSHDFQSNQDVTIGASKPLVAFKKDTYYYEMGLGWEFRLDFVDVCIELRMTNGINNALVRIPDSYYSSSIHSILPRLFGISLMAQN